MNQEIYNALVAHNGLWVLGPIPNELLPFKHKQMVSDVVEVAGFRPLMLCKYSVPAYLAAGGSFGAYKNAFKEAK